MLTWTWYLTCTITRLDILTSNVNTFLCYTNINVYFCDLYLPDLIHWAPNLKQWRQRCGSSTYRLGPTSWSWLDYSISPGFVFYLFCQDELGTLVRIENLIILLLFYAQLNYKLCVTSYILICKYMNSFVLCTCLYII